MKNKQIPFIFAILILCFIEVIFLSNLLSLGGVDVGQITGGILGGGPTTTTATIKPTTTTIKTTTTIQPTTTITARSCISNGYKCKSGFCYDYNSCKPVSGFYCSSGQCCSGLCTTPP